MASEVSQSEQELRRELQRMATEKRSLKQQLRQLEFRERAERAQESGSSAYVVHTVGVAPFTALSFSFLSFLPFTGD